MKMATWQLFTNSDSLDNEFEFVGGCEESGRVDISRKKQQEVMSLDTAEIDGNILDGGSRAPTTWRYIAVMDEWRKQQGRMRREFWWWRAGLFSGRLGTQWVITIYVWSAYNVDCNTISDLFLYIYIYI